MKINLTYTEKEIIGLIQDDIEKKIGQHINEKDIKILVQSKQNYREHTWEHGKLKCELEAGI